MHLEDEVFRIFVESCFEQLKDIEQNILDLEETGQENIPAKIHRISLAAHSIKGDAGSMGLSGIVTLSHKIESVLQYMRDGRLPISASLTSSLLRCFDTLRGLVSRPRESCILPQAEVALLDEWVRQANGVAAPAESPGGMGPVQDREEDLPGRQSPTAVEASDTATGDAGEAHHNHGPSQPAPRETKATETTALPPSPAGADHGRIKTLSIASDQLDRLVDYVGELTMAQSRLSRISTTLHNDQLHSAVEEMERFSVALKGLVLGMRMIPLRTTFMKFRRTIRDLGEQLGKQAELVLEGEDTELDKSVIEELNVPLVHLVRNAMDHGIEPPGQRLAAGKPPRGRIRLTAQHAGNEVHVTLQDDGRGIDTQGLLRTAIDRGIVPPDKQLNQQELLELIYCPGLSESVEVNMVSGRGIGMPAVREAIAAMRGRVDVSSSHGQGTTFQIRLPLSLAIVDCLHLRAADVNFFVQIENVEECIDTTGSSSDFHKGKRTFGFRGKIYPLICLREYFHLGGALSNPSQIVLTRVGEERVGLLVDNVMDQKQAVLKKLGRLFGNVRGIMGCAQMDDGRLAMFLDLSEMVRSTEK